MSSATVEIPPPNINVGYRTSASDDLALFHRTLSELCRAQVPLSRALWLLQTDLRRGKLRTAVGEMAQAVEEGTPLDAAYEQHKDQFPELYRALVEAGIASGNLPGVLDEIARHAHDRAQVAERLRRALAYPVVAAIFVIVLGVALVAFVGPQLREAMTSISSATLSDDTPVLVPPWVTAVGGLGILALAVIAALSFAWLRSPLDAGSALDSIGYRLPLLGRLRLNAAKASFASTMALLAKRGLPLPKALALATAATDDKRIRRCVDVMASRARDGASLTEAVRAGDLISPSLLWLVEAAESSGTAAHALDDVARIYRERLERAVDRMCTLATPLAELLLGVVVLGFAVSYMLPIVQYAEKIAG
ncbi:MAG: type II secretion system F family protein [Planctomycetota bacterium]